MVEQSERPVLERSLECWKGSGEKSGKGEDTRKEEERTSQQGGRPKVSILRHYVGWRVWFLVFYGWIFYTGVTAQAHHEGDGAIEFGQALGRGDEAIGGRRWRRFSYGDEAYSSGAQQTAKSTCETAKAQRSIEHQARAIPCFQADPKREQLQAQQEKYDVDVAGLQKSIQEAEETLKKVMEDTEENPNAADEKMELGRYLLLSLDCCVPFLRRHLLARM